jgi:hypothetical protein
MAILQNVTDYMQKRREAKARSLPKAYIDVIYLNKLGLLFAKGSGQTITEISAKIINRVNQPLHVLIPHGTYFVSIGNHQNMVTRKKYKLTLSPLSTQEINVPASCINANLPIPNESDQFSGVARVSKSAAQFLEASENEDAMVIQAGIWAITDSYSRDQIKSHLRIRRTYIDSTRLSDEVPAISDNQIDKAKEILKKLGIPNNL